MQLTTQHTQNPPENVLPTEKSCSYRQEGGRRQPLPQKPASESISFTQKPVFSSLMMRGTQQTVNKVSTVSGGQKFLSAGSAPPLMNYRVISNL